MRFAAVAAALFFVVTQPLGLPGGATLSSAAEVERLQGAELALVAGPRTGAVQQAGLAIRLEPHWKTYWRTPGDAGIPPSIDWSASKNVAAVAVRYPAPVRFGTDGLFSIGYTEPVVLPLDVTLADPAKPAELAVTVLAGICKDICIPAHATLSLALAPGAPASPEVAAALRRVPMPTTADAPLAVVSVARDAKTEPQGVVATVRVPAGAADLDLFVEGPEGWALPLPERGPDQNGLATYRFALDGLPRDAKPEGAALRFTIVTADRAVEQVVRLP